MGFELREIGRTFCQERAQWESLLYTQGLRPEKQPGLICGVFEEEKLVATGCCCRNTLRCLAVDAAYQGQGLLNTVVSYLMEYQFSQGNRHVFLYTKPESERFFKDLGFYPIDRAERAVVFMENKARGFAQFCESLKAYSHQGETAAIVMNANPFTLGHRHLVEHAAKKYDHVYLFVLSEDVSLIPFSVRWQLVTEGTADLKKVSCLPSGPYIISQATFPSYFLKREEEAILRHAQLDARLFLRIGEALGIRTRCVGTEPNSLVTRLYNETLAEVLPAGGIHCEVIPRLQVEDGLISASTVRQYIRDGNWEKIRSFVPDCTWAYFRSPQAQPVIRKLQATENVKHY